MNRKQLTPHAAYPLTPAASGTRSQVARRRSNRIFLHATVGISGEDRLKCSFTMPAKAINLNKCGAAIQISRDLVVGSVVRVKNQRNVQISARIVSQLTATHGLSTYGIEFVEQQDNAGNFWGISFPSNADERLASNSTMIPRSIPATRRSN
jgi:hypothetical protein